MCQQKNEKREIELMPEEKIIIEKITELLFQEQLITLEEKAKMSRLIREEDET